MSAQFSSPGGPPDTSRMCSLKVDNLSFHTDSAQLLPIFEKYGQVGDIYIPRNPHSRESRGFAFVRFHHKRDAEDAMEHVDGKMIDGRRIRVQIARYGRPATSYRRPRERSERNDRYEDRSYSRERYRSRSRSPPRRRPPSYSPERRRRYSPDPSRREYRDYS